MRRAAPSKRAAGATDTRDAAFGGERVLLTAVAALLGLGLVLVYSSSAAYAARAFSDPQYFIKRQLVWVCVGLAGSWAMVHCPREVLSRRAGWMMLIMICLCSLVLVPGVGVKVGGARRWLSLGVASFQPSEFAKLAVVLLLAALLAIRSRKRDESTKGLIFSALLMQVPVVLILAEPDLGTAVVIEIMVAIMIFSAGIKWRVLGMMVLAALPVFYHLIVATPFRVRRILGYIDPWAYRSTVGYQVTEALISIGSGGLTGVGLGQGKQQLFFLPEAHTDFIFAILAEELGFIGACFVLVAFLTLVWAGTRIAMRARDPFDAYLAIGLTAMIAVPAIINIYVVTGLAPTKGLPLPLISSGGSNLFVTLVAIGMLLRIGRDQLGGQEAGET